MSIEERTRLLWWLMFFLEVAALVWLAIALSTMGPWWALWRVCDGPAVPPFLVALADGCILYLTYRADH